MSHLSYEFSLRVEELAELPEVDDSEEEDDDDEEISLQRKLKQPVESSS